MTRMSGFTFAGRTAVITGAAGGIGRAVARSLATRGCDVVIADIDEAGLEGTAAQIGNAVRVTRHRLDVADEAAVAAFPAIVERTHGRADILVNNAGVALGGRFEDVKAADFEWLFGINFWGVVRMSRAFLPLLRRADEARLVNLSSLFGLIAPPGQAAYSASKFAVRGFSEALRKELVGSGVGVTVVHPGGIRTSIATSARISGSPSPEAVAAQRKRFDKLLKMPPERAGEIIVEGIAHRRDRVLVGSDAKIAALIERLAPVSYWKLIGRSSS